MMRANATVKTIPVKYASEQLQQQAERNSRHSEPTRWTLNYKNEARNEATTR